MNKQQQKQHIIDIMKADEKDGLYETPLIDNYKPDEYDIKNSIRKLFERFLNKYGVWSKLSDEHKEDVKKIEIHDWEIDKLIYDCNDRAFRDWKIDTIQKMELWLDVVKQSASVSENPEEVADRVVRRFKDNFYRF